MTARTPINNGLVMRDHRLTTAEILYHMPDHPTLLQTFLWQEYDIAPDFPMLRRFLSFWERNLEGRLHSVRVANLRLTGQNGWRNAEACLQLH